jgi:hypothetical protein
VKDSSVQSGPDVFDRDLDPQPHRPARSDLRSIVPFQRLIVNPFLTVLGFVIIVAIWYEAFNRRATGLLQLGVALLLGVGFLVQYHCLDCGKTGWLFRYRRHACPAVVARWELGERRRFRGPGVRAQLWLWFIVLASACVLGLAWLISG